jgi:hypothetical protein
MRVEASMQHILDIKYTKENKEKFFKYLNQFFEEENTENFSINSYVVRALNKIVKENEC